MKNQTPSRFITYPDVVNSTGNHTVLLVDADLDDVANLATFCSLSRRDYDIYLYKGSQDDLQWLSYVNNLSSKTFIREPSEVTITGVERYSSIDRLKDYFTNIDKSPQ